MESPRYFENLGISQHKNSSINFQHGRKYIYYLTGLEKEGIHISTSCKRA
jgi:hypothetical protein